MSYTIETLSNTKERRTMKKCSCIPPVVWNVDCPVHFRNGELNREGWPDEESSEVSPITSKTFNPQWDWLYRVIGEEAYEYMYMATYVLKSRAEVGAYKHPLTRQYINVDAEGNKYAYTGNSAYRMER